MTVIRAHFDGGVLVPETPVDLPVGSALELQVTHVQQPTGDEPRVERPLLRLARMASEFPANPDSPRDGAAQHDHYLYGTPKRP